MLDLAPFVAASMLTVESRLWRFTGVKESVVRDAFGFGMTRYYQLLNALIDTELALVLDPVTTNRLRARREAGQRSRRLPLPA